MASFGDDNWDFSSNAETDIHLHGGQALGLLPHDFKRHVNVDKKVGLSTGVVL
jgi:hypothetical protein